MKGERAGVLMEEVAVEMGLMTWILKVMILAMWVVEVRLETEAHCQRRSEPLA